VLPVPEPLNRIRATDVEYRTTTSSVGAGGQHRNKTESAVIATHKPSGTQVKCESERSQHRNKAIAYQLLAAEVAQAEEAKALGDRNAIRKVQVGSGQRGDKIRTIRWQDNTVKCAITGRSKQLRGYLEGDLTF
jgi:peptide chain release factor 1